MNSLRHNLLLVLVDVLPLLAQAGSATLAQTTAQSRPTFRCPPFGFSALKEFDLTSFLSNQPYYVYAQLHTAYEDERQLFCVKQSFIPYNESNIVTKGLKLERFARQGSPTGPIVTNGYTQLKARFTDRKQLGKMEVSAQDPKNTKFQPGPYWIIAAAPDYSWVITIAGPPSNLIIDVLQGQTTCDIGHRNPTLRARQTGGNGLWLLTKSAFPSADDQLAMLNALRVLKVTPEYTLVQHEGCRYTT